jgi:hypothetical protein
MERSRTHIVKDAAEEDTAEEDSYGSVHSRKKGGSAEKLVHALQKHETVDMEKQA